MPYLESGEKGAFALVRTSNKGAQDLQYMNCEDGDKVFYKVGEKLQNLGERAMAKCGYSNLGAVIGCTHVDEGKILRERLGKTFFLIPGYGAQGGKAEDVAIYLKNGNGGVVNSSRKILLAYKGKDDDMNFAKYARLEAISMRDEIRKACGR